MRSAMIRRCLWAPTARWLAVVPLIVWGCGPAAPVSDRPGTPPGPTDTSLDTAVEVDTADTDTREREPVTVDRAPRTEPLVPGCQAADPRARSV